MIMSESSVVDSFGLFLIMVLNSWNLITFHLDMKALMRMLYQV